MNNLKIYDVNAFLNKNCQKEAFRYERVAIFVGPSGVVVAEYEAVHMLENVVSDTVRIPCNDPPSDGKIWITPQYTANVKIEDILAEAPCTEMSMSDFFSKREYNIRCEKNWSTLLASLRDIGFDTAGYL